MSTTNIPVQFNNIKYNTDIDPHIAKDTTDYMLNTYIEEAGNYGVLTNMKGNIRIPITIPEGINEFIYTANDIKNHTMILFLYNSEGNHCIFRYDVNNNKVDRVIWSNSILGFSLDHRIKRADIVDNFVYWVDGYSENKRINIPKAINFTNATSINCTLSGSYFTSQFKHGLSEEDKVLINIQGIPYTGVQKVKSIVNDYSFIVYGQTSFSSTASGTITPYINSYTQINEDTINVIQRPPEYRPDINFYTDNTRNINNIRGNLFQFAYRYINEDYSFTRFSPITEVPLPAYAEDGLGDFTTSIYVQNCIKIDYPVRDYDVKKVEIAFRKGNTGQWYIAERKTVTTLTDTSYFYNDGAYDSIENVEVLTGYDDVPLSSQTQSFVDSKYICYIQNKKGYDPIDINVKLTPTYNYQDYQVSYGNKLTQLETYTNARGERNDSITLNQDSKKYGTFTLSSGGDIPPRPCIRTLIKTHTFSSGFTAGQFVKISILKRSTNAVMDSKMFYVPASAITNTAINAFLYSCFQYFNKYGTFFASCKSIPFGFNEYKSNSNKINDYAYACNYLNTVSRFLGAIPTGYTGNDVEFQSAYLKGDDLFGNTQSIKDLSSSDYQYKAASNSPAYPTASGYNLLNQSGVSSSFQREAQIAAMDGYVPLVEVYASSTILSTYKFPSFKLNASHPFALVYMDKSKRRCGACVSKDSTVYVKSESEIGQTNKYYSQIQWQINHEAPDWAYYYQWYYAGNTRTQSYTQCIASFVNNPTDTIFTEIGLKWLTKYKTEHPSSNISTYTWVKGDRVRLIGQEPYLDGTKVCYVPAFKTMYDFEILGQDSVTGNIWISRISSLPGDPNNVNHDWHGQTPSDIKIPDYWGKLTNHSGYNTYNNGVNTPSDLPSKQDNGDPIQNNFYTWINTTSGGYRAGTIFVYENGWNSTDYNINYNTTYLYGTLIEIYTPTSKTETTVYYEYSDVFPINRVGTHRYHAGTNQNQDDILPAKGLFTTGDSYFMTSNMYPLSGWVPFVMEKNSYSEWYSSQCRDMGRPTISIDQSVTGEFNTLQLSRPYVPNTNTNGLCTFDWDETVYSIPIKNGKIFQCFNLGNVLKIYQRNKATAIYIGKYRTMNEDGSSNLITANAVLGSNNISRENYGTNYPESVSGSDSHIYFFDLDAATMIQDSQGGLVPISTKYGTAKWFKDKCDEIRKNGEENYRIVSIYDKKINTLFVTFIYGKQAETIAYYEPKEEWRGAFSFTPSLYASFGQNTFSFKNGQMWKHNADNAKRCNFYGVQYPFEITSYVNEQPQIEKKYLNVTLDANRPVNMDIETHSDISYKLGGKSLIKRNLFVQKEGLFHCEILKNMLSNGGVSVDRLYSGSVMTGKGAKIKISDNSGEKIILKSMIVGVNT